MQPSGCPQSKSDLTCERVHVSCVPWATWETPNLTQPYSNPPPLLCCRPQIKGQQRNSLAMANHVPDQSLGWSDPWTSLLIVKKWKGVICPCANGKPGASQLTLWQERPLNGPSDPNQLRGQMAKEKKLRADLTEASLQLSHKQWESAF